MATITSTLTIASTDAFASQALSLSTNHTPTVVAPMADISRMATNDNPYGFGAGVIIDEEDTNDYFVYIRHLGIKGSDDYAGGSTTAADAADTVIVGNGDLDASSKIITLKSGEFCYFPTTVADGTDGGVEVGGIAVVRGGDDEVVIEYGFWHRG